jgi:hypothetical protein
MYKSDVDSYRNAILSYFEKKDKHIHKILNDNVSDWRFPFKTAFKIHSESEEKVDIVSFLSATMLFNKYKYPIRKKASHKMPERGDHFLNSIIEEKKVYNVISSFNVSVYIASKMMEKISRDQNFNWFMKYKTEIDNELFDPEFIIVDTANIHKSIMYYEGENDSLIKFRDVIINKRPLSQCLREMVTYITSELNYNYYKYIFITPTKHSYFGLDHFIIPVDCTDYIGEKCSKETFSNEVDDSLLLMMYDYCRFKYDVKISVLSRDNFDYSYITQDYSSTFDRAVFYDENPSIIANWEEIQQDYPGFTFKRGNLLTIFEEEFNYDSD